MLPHYLAIGLDHNTFFHSTPRILEAYDKAQRKKLEMADLLNWYQGQYFSDALLSTIGNSGWFHKKGEKPNEYPTQPYIMKIQEMREENENLSEEEIIARTKALFGRLEIMAVNNRLDKQANE